MKRILSFIASFVIPKKMLKHREMNIFVILIILLLAFFACTFISNLRVRAFVERSPETVYYFCEMTDMVEEKDANAVLPSFTVEEGRVKDAEIVMNTVNNPYTFTYKASEEDIPLEVEMYYFLDKIVFEAGEVKSETAVIDYNLLNLHDVLTNPYDNDLNKKSNKLLMIYTNSVVFYIFNNGYVLNNGKVINYLDNSWTMYETNEDGETLYFLPKDASEIDDNHWTTISKEGEKVTIPGYGEYVARKQVTQNLHKIFFNSKNFSTRVGHYEYSELDHAGINLYKYNENTKWSEVLENFAEATIQSSMSYYKSRTTLNGLIFILALPFGWSFLIWMLTKRFGQLKYYKEYLAIAATSMVLPSILICIVSCFIPYFQIAYWGMLLMAAFYFLTIICINGTRRQSKPTDDENDNDKTNNYHQKINYDIETKKVAEMD